METNYFALKTGHILQPNEELVIYGLKHRVNAAPSTDKKHFLLNESGYSNSKIFRMFGMNDWQKEEWAQSFGPIECGGAFPEFHTLEDLTKFVIAIYETPLFKVGDKVRVKERTKPGDKYPFFFADEMAKKLGGVFTITEHWIPDAFYGDISLFEGDIHGYKLNGSVYSWHSSMFEKVSDVTDITAPELPKEKAVAFAREEFVSGGEQPLTRTDEVDKEEDLITLRKSPIKTIIKL